MKAAKGAMKGFKAAQSAGEHLRAAYCLTSLSETRRKSPAKRPAGGLKGSSGISRKAPGRSPKDMLLGPQGRNEGRQGRHEGFKGSSGRRGAFKGSLLPNVAFWNEKKISRKAPGRWPKDMLLGRQGRNEGRQGRHEGF